jgi:D-aspartate ligase
MTGRESAMAPARSSPPAAIVMNMFYTGLGIARSLGEGGARVIGLTAQRRIYGNYTRYADVRFCPDSREQPQELLRFLLALRNQLPSGGLIFPTRDDDVLFLDRHREELEAHFSLVIPGRAALEVCLDKWQTYRWSQEAGIDSPRCWRITGLDDVVRALPQVHFPCVLKPVSAHQWRQGRNWAIVGSRKAVAVDTAEQALAEYRNVMRAERTALLQEMVPGGDDCLWIAACYLNRDARFVAGFTAQKVLQVPPRFGTGCIVQTVDAPEVLERAGRLLERMGYSGIAEVEFKRDPVSQEYKLIEINPRAWDQHPLGRACGVDLIHIAYCDRAGLPLPPIVNPQGGLKWKWVAEDVFAILVLQALFRRDGRLRSLLRLASGRRIFAIWSRRDPLPSLGFFMFRFGPGLLAALPRYVWRSSRRAIRARFLNGKELSHEDHPQNSRCEN